MQLRQLQPCQAVQATTSTVTRAGRMAAVTAIQGASGVGPAANPQDGTAPMLLVAAIQMAGESRVNRATRSVNMQRVFDLSGHQPCLLPVQIGSGLAVCLNSVTCAMHVSKRRSDRLVLHVTGFVRRSRLRSR